MELPPDLQTQVWVAIHRLKTEGAVEAISLQTSSPTQLNGNIITSDKISLQLAHNFSSSENFDALDFEFACYNQQSTLGHLITMILYAIVCIIGLFGNTLVIYVVLRFSKMQTVTNIYILNLAIADECFLIGIPFLLYTMQKGSWQFGEYMCKAYMVSTSITQFTSSIFLLIMAADRYIAVCHPISSPRYRTPFVSRIVSGLAWIMSALFMLPVMLFANSVQVNDHVSCNIKWPESNNIQSFIWYSLALGFALPLTFIMFFYCLVIRKLHSVELKHKSKEKKRSHRKVTKLVMTVIAVYVLCWLPYWIAQLVLINTHLTRCATALEILVFLLVGCLGYSNSAVNPLLYAFLSDNFKKSFLRAFNCIGIMRKDGVTGEQQAGRSIFPKWGSRRPTLSQGDDGNESGYGGGNNSKGGGGGCGGGGGGTGSGGTSRSFRKGYNSNPSRFLGTSTAGGTGMTGTSVMDDAISDITPMEPIDVAESEILCENSSFRNISDKRVINSDSVGTAGDQSSRPTILQTDL